MCPQTGEISVIPHKYAYLPDVNKKQKIVEIELARLQPSEGSVPVLASCESEVIRIFNWDSDVGEWDSHIEVAHHPVTRTGTGMRDVSNWNWSSRIGLAAGGADTFLLYKRTIEEHRRGGIFLITGLLVDWYRLTSPTGNLYEVTRSAKIPVEELGFSRPGYYLWSGYDSLTKRLLVLAQVFRLRRFVLPIDPEKLLPSHWVLREERGEQKSGGGSQGVLKSGPVTGPVLLVEESLLVLLSADVSTIANSIPVYVREYLQDPSSWKVTIVDEGGYDFDALLMGGKIYCVHRQAPYAITIRDEQKINPQMTTSQRVEIPSDLNNDSIYAPLRLRVVDVGTLTVEGQYSENALPGGEHPQIQNTLPFIVTCDRVHAGSFVVSASPGGGPSGVSSEIAYFQKVMLYKGPQAWSKGRLFIFQRGLVPSHLDNGMGWEQHEHKQEVSGSTVKFASLDCLHPMYLTGMVAIPELKAQGFDFIHHVPGASGTSLPDLEALAVTRFALYIGPQTMATVAPPGHVILDISHAQITKALGQGGAEENSQFEPFEVGGYLTIDNTMGGALVVDRSLGRLGFYAYVDLGDRCLRVVFDENMPDPNPPLSHDIKAFSADVTGTGSSSDEMVEITLDGWQPSALAANMILSRFPSTGAYFTPRGDTELSPASPGSGVDVLLDTLIYNVWSTWPSDADGTATLTSDRIAFIESLAPGSTSGLNSLKDLLAANLEGVEIDSFRVRFGKYVLDFYLKTEPQGEVDKIVITPLDTHDTHMRFLGRSVQGIVDYRFNIGFETGKGKLTDTDLYELVSLKSNFYYGRMFTPGILMTEKRRKDPFRGPGESPYFAPPIELVGEGKDNRPEVITCKPFGPTYVQAQPPLVKVRMTTRSRNKTIIIAVIALLSGLGFAAIASDLSGLLALLLSPLGIIGFVAIIAAIVTILVVVVPNTLASSISAKVLGRIMDPLFKAELDGWPMMWYVGEGAAEAIAAKAVEKAGMAVDPDQPGRNRFRQQSWQMIHVSQDRCRLYFRR